MFVHIRLLAVAVSVFYLSVASAGSYNASQRLATGVRSYVGDPQTSFAASHRSMGATVTERATEAAKSSQRFERMADGRVRIAVPLHDLEARVGNAGTTFASIDNGGHGTFRWRLEAIGRDGHVIAPKRGTILREDRVVRVLHEGFAEEYTVSADGIRQDVILSKRPDGTGTLRLALSTDGAALRLTGDAADAVSVWLSNGRLLEYQPLRFTDASGRPVPARITLDGRHMLSLSVDDTEAEYPVRFSTTLSDPDWHAIAVPGFNRHINALVFGSGNLYVGGGFTIANGGVRANGVAKWDGNQWSPVGSGIDSPFSVYIKALAWDENDQRLFAAGSFTFIDGTSARNLAQWDGTSWSQIGAGVYSGVNAIVWDGPRKRLYWGGPETFGRASWDGTHWTQTTSRPTQYDATWVDGTIQALALDPSDGRVFVGGTFERPIFQDTVKNVGVFGECCFGRVDTRRQVDGGILALAWDPAGRRLFAGGISPEMISPQIPAPFLAQWTEVDSWRGVTGHTPTGRVNALLWDAASSRLFIAHPSGLHTWDGTASEVVGNYSRMSMAGGHSGGPVVAALALDPESSALYAVGDMSFIDGIGVNRIGTWNGESWSSVGGGTNGNVRMLIWDDARHMLIAGGEFTTVGDVSAAAGAAWWDGDSWNTFPGLVLGRVQAMAWDSQESRLFAVGVSHYNEEGASSGGSGQVSYWTSELGWRLLAADFFDGRLESPSNAVPKGDESSDGIITLAWDRTCKRLYAGNDSWGVGYDASNLDYFDFLTGEYVRRLVVVRWPEEEVTALDVEETTGRVAIGGNFVCSSTNGYSNNVAVLVPDSTCTTPGTVVCLGTSYFDSSVATVKWGGERLFVGGYFRAVGGTTAVGVAQWDGQAWSALGEGLDHIGVYALEWDARDGRLFVGGQFTSVGGKAAPSIAQWDGTSWARVGSGIEWPVGTLAWSNASGTLFAGGFSSQARSPLLLGSVLAIQPPSNFIFASGFE